ncbi:hypothetical protein B0H11DRAFT_2221193 [Mycena galericulata]|nr:hypothetical protein B0H11DRAFT_2221193 [Mycena galericulata]
MTFNSSIKMNVRFHCIRLGIVLVTATVTAVLVKFAVGLPLCSFLAVYPHPSWQTICHAEWSPDPRAHIKRMYTRRVPERSAMGHSPSTQPRNFALLEAGAHVIYELTSDTHGLSTTCKLQRWLTLGRASCNHKFVLPTDVIRERNQSAAPCWTFTGSEGHIAIQLGEPVKITNITLDNIHLPGPFFPDERAPKDMTLWGLVPHAVLKNAHQDEKSNRVFATPSQFSTIPPLPHLSKGFRKGDQLVILAQFEYNLEPGPLRQTFVVHPASGTLTHFDMVILDITSNRGSLVTCVPRLSLQGDPLSPQDL